MEGLEASLEPEFSQSTLWESCFLHMGLISIQPGLDCLAGFRVSGAHVILLPDITKPFSTSLSPFSSFLMVYENTRA